jgi:hypothetical protein
MSRKAKNPLVEILTFLRNATDEQLNHIAAQAAVELKARQPEPDNPFIKPRKARKVAEAPVTDER